jgi:hypothetical protein
MTLPPFDRSLSGPTDVKAGNMLVGERPKLPQPFCNLLQRFKLSHVFGAGRITATSIPSEIPLMPDIFKVLQERCGVPRNFPRVAPVFPLAARAAQSGVIRCKSGVNSQGRAQPDG